MSAWWRLRRAVRLWRVGRSRRKERRDREAAATVNAEIGRVFGRVGPPPGFRRGRR